MTLLNGTMTPIQTITVGSGGQAAIEFTNIPQTYTDLSILVSARHTNNAYNTGVTRITFNGTTSGYSNLMLGSDGASPYSGTNNYGVTSAAVILFNSNAGSTSNTFGNGMIYIPNYTSSTNKSFMVDSVAENNATTIYTTQMGMIGALFSNNAVITSIKLEPQGDEGNYAQYSTFTLYGIQSAGTAAKATGGIITSDANYYYHTFTASGTFTPKQNISNVDYLVVAGGGGGVRVNAGGGAGGLRSTVTATGGGGSLESPLSLTAQAYTVTVGAGGSGGSGLTGTATNGSNSVFSTITSTGGGAGGAYMSGTPGNNGNSGGSGGGGGYIGGGFPTSTTTGGAGTANQGYAGGNGQGGGPGGGGGAGAVGGNGADAGNTGGAGGNGVAVSITGSSVYYAGGGGAGSEGSNPGAGGLGGGGNGTKRSPYVVGSAGTANTGGGGGGGENNATNGFAGGSGIVIIRYAK